MSIGATTPAGRTSAKTRVNQAISNAAATAGVVTAMVFGFAGATRAQIPNINIEETCRAAARAMVSLMGGTLSQNDFDSCMASEKNAHQQLLSGLASFQPSDRALCIQAGAYLPSYIEWLTCFEMSKTVREASKTQGTKPNDPSVIVTLPKVRPAINY
jgi:hypothetical protein